MITVEYCLWLSFLVATAFLVGQDVVTPLVANAQAQAALNADSMALIQAAMAVCQP